jgi:nucleoside-triphosphatase THEP1
MDFIKNWIIDSYTNYKCLSCNSCLFITGNSGIGKTHTIHNICNELDLFTVNINSYNCNSSKQLNDLLFKSFVSSLIQCLTNNTQKKIIIIDEFETLLSFDSTMNIHLLHFLNTKHKHIPIICICSNDIVKKLGEIKKQCLFYELPVLSDKVIHNILISYNQHITINESIEIIKKSNYNIKKCIQIISNTYYNNNDDIFDINELYANNFNRNNFKRLIMKDQWIIPLKFHENLILELNNRSSIISFKYKYYKSFIYNFCNFDIIMMKNNEIAIDYFISIIHTLFTLKKKKNTAHNLNNFTKLLSYLSLQKKNNKIIYKLHIPYNHFNGNYHLSIINRKFIY